MGDTKPVKPGNYPEWRAPVGRVWRVRVVLDVLVGADSDRGAMRRAMEMMREEDRYQVEEVVT